MVNFDLCFAVSYLYIETAGALGGDKPVAKPLSTQNKIRRILESRRIRNHDPYVRPSEIYFGH
jgi:hypothetical protein